MTPWAFSANTHLKGSWEAFLVLEHTAGAVLRNSTQLCCPSTRTSVWQRAKYLLLHLGSLLEKKPYWDENERPKSGSRSGAEAIPPGSYAKFPLDRHKITLTKSTFYVTRCGQSPCVSVTGKYKNWFEAGGIQKTAQRSTTGDAFIHRQTPMACKSSKTEWLLLFPHHRLQKRKKNEKPKEGLREFIMNGNNQMSRQTKWCCTKCESCLFEADKKK